MNKIIFVSDTFISGFNFIKYCFKLFCPLFIGDFFISSSYIIQLNK
ncbi:hypothetical protein HMPREF0208_00486 [Citrobacter koseri]|nr:hypothetical protein HMPREF3220_01299 [Citrobacter koseri]KXA05447.1 hypothetical protein HMPREF3207_00796 [Citrobacter koseri]KXB46869.1 hypothetical protein HMPREF0208_00486 [Citrobacter koseri]